MTLVKSKVTNAKTCQNKPVISRLGATIYCRRVMCPMPSFAAWTIQNQVMLLIRDKDEAIAT